MRSTARFAALTSVVVLSLGAPQLVRSQDAATPARQFEVASIKKVIRENEPERPNRSKTDTSFVGKAGNPFKVSGRRVEIQGTALALIAAAYDVKPYQIENAPGWADSSIYSVIAETSGDAVSTVPQLRQMMQSLLADRMHLRLHAQKKQVNVYYLMPSKTKTALTAAADDEPFTWKLYRAEGNTLRSKATHESILDFVQLVGVSADRPVIDRTGLHGFIDYDILINMNGEDPRDPEAVSRAILDAVKDQLGLKLQPAKDDIEFLIADEIELPSDN
jgi:uncharacterized protein (TIGR03435 family)